MGDTKIEWAQKVWNPVTGCTKISSGCQNCYAERMAKRLRGRYGYPSDDPFKVTFHGDKLYQPLHWKKPQRVFVCSMGDLFHGDMSFAIIDAIFDVIAKCSWHTFIILTKRPENALEFYEWGKGLQLHLISNLWLGVTAENQEQADKRIPILLQIPAAVRFVSVEPMLGAVDLTFIGCPHCGQSKNPWFPNYTICRACGKEVKSPPDNKIDLIICGGESGPKARPMHPDWARKVRDDCVKAGVPFFFKQWGANVPHLEFLKRRSHYLPRPSYRSMWVGFSGKTYKTAPQDDYSIYLMHKVGKKAAGRKLDGQIYNQLPGE
jgi:protein gp37